MKYTTIYYGLQRVDCRISCTIQVIQRPVTMETSDERQREKWWFNEWEGKRPALQFHYSINKVNSEHSSLLTEPQCRHVSNITKNVHRTAYFNNTHYLKIYARTK